MNEYIIGIDIAKKHDRTVIAVGRKSFVPQADGRVISYLDIVDLQMIEKMTYPDQARYVRKLDGDVRLSGNNDLVIDGTGVGEVVYDNLRDIGLNPLKIIFTGGDDAHEIITENRAGFKVFEGWNVPKHELVDNLALMLQQRRVRIAKGIHFEKDIREQFSHFQGKLTQSKNMVYGNDKDCEYDDIVAVMAMVCWFFMQNEGSRSDYRYKEPEFQRDTAISSCKNSVDYDPCSSI